MKPLAIALGLLSFYPLVNLQAQGVDSDNDGTPDAADYYPYNPFKDKDDWGQTVETYPEVFVASDVSERNKDGLVRDLRLAANYFGKYEMEWWAVGTDISALLKLAAKWCDRRIERGQLFYYEGERNDLVRMKSICMTEVAHPHANLDWSTSDDYYFTGDIQNYKGWMEEYRQVSLLTPQSSTNAGGRRDMGYTAAQSTWPFVFDTSSNPSEWGIKEQENAILAFHEYYHIVQDQYVSSDLYIVDETGNTVRPDYGFTALSEGSANYYSQYAVRKLSKLGMYQGSVGSESLKELMRYKMDEILNMLPNCPNFQIERLNYGNPCDPYTFGMWATAFLTNKAGNIDVFHEVFWPKINEMTFVGAFEDTFGLNYDQFNTAFKEFLFLPREEQLEIVPEINFVDPTEISRKAASFSVDTLSVPSVIVSEKAYNLELGLTENSPAGVIFTISSAELIDPPEVPSSIYWSKVGLLDIPEVEVNSITYSVSLELESETDLRFRLVLAEETD